MMKLEDLKRYCISLSERLDSKVDDQLSEKGNVIQEISRFCSSIKLAKSVAQLEEDFPDQMDRIQQHFLPDVSSH